MSEKRAGVSGDDSSLPTQRQWRQRERQVGVRKYLRYMITITDQKEKRYELGAISRRKGIIISTRS